MDSKFKVGALLVRGLSSDDINSRPDEKLDSIPESASNSYSMAGITE